MKYLLSAAFISALVIGCSSSQTTTSANDGWQTIFDGKTPGKWRAFNGTGFPENWVIENGTLKGLGKAHDAAGGDIVYGGDSYDEFELELDWKIAQGGNSGIFYRVQEGSKYTAPYQTGPEYQLIDDTGFPEKLEEWQKTGSDYAMYNAPADKLLKPVGEWNSTRIRVTDKQVTYWLNGKITAQFEPYGTDWTTKRNSGKWEAYPDYAKVKSGLIGLQDHGSPVWFKNIRIKKI